MYGRALVHVLHQPLTRILQDMTQILATLTTVAEDQGKIDFFCWLCFYIECD